MKLLLQIAARLRRPASSGILSVILVATASAQWSTQSPVPTHLDVRGIWAPGPGRVFVATDDDPFDAGGALFESTDGGVSWTQRDIPLSLHEGLNGLSFLDNQNGWVFGNDNYRTTDGGITWTQLPFLGSTYAMRFFTHTFGIASGNFGELVSHDGGNSWVASPGGMYAFDFLDNQVGLGVADSALYRSTDGGATFSVVLAGNAQAVAFLPGAVAIGIVNNAIVRSTDSGATWAAGPASEGRTNLLAVSADVALAWGHTGSFPDFDDRMLRSTDGGQTWADLGEVIPGGVNAMVVVQPQTLVASDPAGNMYLSTDAGLHWIGTFVSPGPQPGFLSTAAPAFADNQTGFCGYGSGFIIKTTDAGASWLQVSSGTGNALNDIDRFPNGTMIAVGESGALLTSNGSSTWVLHGALSQHGLRAVQVFGAENAAAVDETGQVFLSTDGAETWAATASHPQNLSPAEDVHFTSPSNGWVIGQGGDPGVLHHTTDGGVTWTSVPTVLGACMAVDVEGTNIWAANITGSYSRSTDGGNTWVQEMLPGFPSLIRDMEFVNESVGYAVGASGYAARSNDGGASWQLLPTPPANDNFTDISLIGPDEIWLSAGSNLAYYSATGGQNWAVMNTGPAGFGTLSGIVASPAGNAWTVGFQGRIEGFSGPPPPPLNRPPQAMFGFTASGLAVSFADSSFDPDGVVVSRRWDFGDSSASTEQHPLHVFPRADSYIVRLTVMDDDGDSSNIGRLVTVQPNPGGTFGDFTEVTPVDSVFVTPQDEDFWVVTTAPADYDGDGDLDVAVLGYYVVYNQSVDERLLLLRNDGPGTSGQWAFTYVRVPLGTLTTGASDLAWGDADGDGDQDLAVGSDDQTVLYRNDAGTLMLTDTELPGYWEENSQADFDVRSITWADVDNDGDQDLLLPSVYVDSSFSFRTALMRNDGPNASGGRVFTEINAGIAATSHAQSSWADVDGDQDLDLLLVNMAPLIGDGFIRVYRNNGQGGFVGDDILGALAVEHGEAQWGDYDADGDMDILVAGNIKETNGTYTEALRIYRNNNGSYDSLEVIPCIPCEGWFELTAATWADYDTDGDMDILVAGTYNSGSQIDGRAKVYTNVGGVFADSGNVLPAPRASGERGGTFSWMDIDGEGDLDYFIAGQYFVPGGNGLVEAQMHLYRNDATGQNAAPSAPAGLGVTMQDSTTVLLSWNRATDDHTPDAALTYDFGLFHDGVPVVLPRHVPEPGNLSAVTEWLLTGLPDGQYHWTLRAVDASYAGSAVAAGQFVIGGSTGVAPALLPHAYHFEQNYPNPFNPSTTFRFELGEQAHVELAIYNLNGQLVNRLVDETRQAGIHEVRWDARGLASGVYFARLSTPAFVRIQRVTLLK